MEGGGRRDSEARVCLFRSPAAAKDAPRAVSVWRPPSVPLAPVLPGPVRLCLCPARAESRVGGPRGPG